MSNYRKIYEKYYGQIPTDDEGRTYEIHHIDGNNKNNSISNLRAVSIQEHYDIHFSQGDWQACLYISARMKISSELRSQLASNAMIERTARGENPAALPKNRKASSERQLALIAAGKHTISQSEECIERSRQKNLLQSSQGLHPFQNVEFIERNKEITKLRNQQLWETGTHPFQNEERIIAKIRRLKGLAEQGLLLFQQSEFRDEGSKRSTIRNNKLASEGNHPWQDPDLIERNRIRSKERMFDKDRNPAHKIENRQSASERLKLKIECPHCGKIGNPMAMKRWHFDRCKLRII